MNKNNELPVYRPTESDEKEIRRALINYLQEFEPTERHDCGFVGIPIRQEIFKNCVVDIQSSQSSITCLGIPKLYVDYNYDEYEGTRIVGSSIVAPFLEDEEHVDVEIGYDDFVLDRADAERILTFTF